MVVLGNQPNRICRVVDGEALIMDTAACVYYSLNSTATEILTSLQTGRQPLDILAQLHETYALAEEDFTLADLEAVIAQLKAEKLWEAPTND